LKSHQVTFQPAGATLEVEDGVDLFVAAGRAGLSVANTCRGKGTCMQCRVQVLKGNAPPDTDALTFLSHDEIRDRFVLACHTPVNDNLVIFVPPLP